MSFLSDQELERQVMQHTPLVEALARSLARKLPASVERDDLVQDGQVALINAILSTSKKVTAEHFRNYVALRVQGAMLDGLRELDHGSRQLRKDMRVVELTIHRLAHVMGRAPRESEVAEAMGIGLRKYQRLLQDASGYALISLEDLVASDPQWAGPTGGQDADPLGILERAALREALLAALDGLPQQHSSVLYCYYVDDLKMHQIGQRLQVTEARVSQIHAQAIALLRAKLVDDSGAMPMLKPRRSARGAVRN